MHLADCFELNVEEKIERAIFTQKTTSQALPHHSFADLVVFMLSKHVYYRGKCTYKYAINVQWEEPKKFGNSIEFHSPTNSRSF